MIRRVMSVVEHERAFELFGTRVRVLVGERVTPGLPEPEIAAIAVEVFLRKMHQALTRFEKTSELSVLNTDPADEVAVSPLLARAVAACLETAERTGGLVDPTLVDEIER